MIRCLRLHSCTFLQSQRLSFDSGRCQFFGHISSVSAKNSPQGSATNLQNNNNQFLSVNSLIVDFTRSNTSFFNKVTAQQLWKGVTSVSNAGKKRGRGKGVGKKSAKDLNKGQIIGIGKSNIVWPGLNAPVIQGKELIQQRQLPPDPDRDAKLLKLRDSMGRFKPLKLSPLERGWSGAKMHGRSVGPPDPIGQDTFEGFDTRILEMKTVTNMDGNIGRCKRFSVVAFTGNRNGLGGLALGKSPEGRAALKKAKNRAGQKLLYIQRFREHTVLHDFFTQFGQTKIFVYKKHEGFGLVCHRAIRTMCELIGIKDLYAKIEGPTNLQHIVKAFLLGLLRQKSHEELAEAKQLYLVEQRLENSLFPTVLGAPSSCRTEEEIGSDETMDFNQFAMDDKVPLRRKKIQPFYTRLPGWQYHLLRTEWRRNHYQTRVSLLAEFREGRTRACKSHLTATYPECDQLYSVLLKRKNKNSEELAE